MRGVVVKDAGKQESTFRCVIHGHKLFDGYEVVSEELLSAAGDFTKLLGQHFIHETEIAPLEADPIILVSYEIDRPHEKLSRTGFAAATDSGELVLFELEELSNGEVIAHQKSRLRIPAYSPDSHSLVGLYWTKQTTVFNDRADLVLIVRKNGIPNVYRVSADPDEATELELVGRSLPAWMRFCHVALSPSEDALKSTPCCAPPPGSRCAIRHGEFRLFIVLDGGRVADYRSSRDCFDPIEGDSGQCVDGQLIIVHPNQALIGYRINQGEQQALTEKWRQSFTRQPLSICFLPSENPRRVIVGFENGGLTIGVIVPPDTIKSTWRGLGARIWTINGISTFAEFINWSDSILKDLSQTDPEQQKRAVTLLLMVLDQLNGGDYDELFTSSFAEHYRRISRPEDFRPFVDWVRCRIREWQEKGGSRHAGALFRFYEQLTYELQDLVDIELKLLTPVVDLEKPDKESSTDDKALKRLLQQRHVNRQTLKEDPTTSLASKVILNLEEWAEPFVLELAEFAPGARPALVRDLSVIDAALIVHTDGLCSLNLRSKRLEEITSETWFRPSQAVRVPRSFSPTGPLLIIADHNRLCRLDIGQSGEAEWTAQVSLPASSGLIRTACVGDKLFLMAAADSLWGGGNPSIRLFSLANGLEEVASGTLETPQPPKEFRAVQANKGWLVFMERGSHELMALFVSHNDAGKLTAVRVGTRKTPGRIRSLAISEAKPDVLFVGTTEGFILALNVGGVEPTLDPLWLYQASGSIRHLDCIVDEDDNLRVLALTATQKVLVLGEMGRLLWFTKLQSPLRSGAFINGPQGLSIVVADVDGIIRLYRKSDEDQPRGKAQAYLHQIGKDWSTIRRPARREFVEGVQMLEDGKLVDAIATAETSLARVCTEKALVELDIVGVSPRKRLEALEAVIASFRFDELRRLAREPSGPFSPVELQHLTLHFLQEIRFRTDSDGSSVDQTVLREATRLTAELIRGLGSTVLQPNDLHRREFEEWWCLPVSIRENNWVLCSLLEIAAMDSVESSDRLSYLIISAIHTGPAGFQVIPLLAPSRDVLSAQALTLAVEMVQRSSEKNLDENTLHALDIQTDSIMVRSFTCLLKLIYIDEPSWEEFVDAISAMSRGGIDQELRVPGLRSLFASVDRYRELTIDAYAHAKVEEQQRVIEQLQIDELSLPECSCIWKEWIDKALVRLRRNSTNVLLRQRKHLARQLWVRLEEPVVRRVGRQTAILSAKLEPDGVRRPTAEVKLSVENEALSPIDQPFSDEWKVEKLPPEIRWFGMLKQDVGEVVIKVDTKVKAERYSHEHWWRLPVPPKPARSGERLFQRVPEVCASLVKPLRSIKTGLHLVAIDEELGPGEFVEAFASGGRTKVMDLDARLEKLGPGGREPQGLTTSWLLQQLGAVSHGDKPRTRIKAGAGNDRVVVYPAIRVGSQLLRPQLQPMLNALKKVSIVGHPVFLILPTEIASRLEARLDDAFTLQIVAHLEPVILDVETEQELATLLSEGGIEKERLQEVLNASGWDLRLLSGWLIRHSESGEGFESYLASELAETQLRESLSGLGPREIGYAVVCQMCRSRIPIGNLKVGMIASETWSTTTGGKVKGKELIRNGTEFGKREINALFSDHSPPSTMVVKGILSDRRDATIQSSLQPLFDALRHDTQTIARSLKKLQKRRVVTRSGGIYHTREPFASWIANHLRADPRGRQLIESLLGQNLIDRLSLTELSAAGDGLKALFPEFSSQAVVSLIEVGQLYTGDADRDRIRSAFERLSGRQLSVLDDDYDLSTIADALQDMVGGECHFFHMDVLAAEHRHLLGFVNTSTKEKWYCDTVLTNKKDSTTVILTGPGLVTDIIGTDNRICVLSEPQIKDVLCSAQPKEAFRRMLRNQTGLSKHSPFQVLNYLPEGSPVFVGRANESSMITESLGKSSFLILGARQIGKTSLLRHVYGIVRKNGDYQALWLPCEGVKKPKGFAEKLQEACQKKGIPFCKNKDPLESIERTLKQVTRPVLFVNEVDGLSKYAVPLLERLRSLSEERVCQLVMTGYHRAYADTRFTKHPFFHWVRGEVGEKAIILGALSDQAARELVGKLETSELELEWENDETRAVSIDKILERSHRIPFLLQKLCQDIVYRLEEENRLRITSRDIDEVLRSRNLMWEYLENSSKVCVTGDSADTPSPDEVFWCYMVLASIAREKYWTKDPDDQDRARFSLVDNGSARSFGVSDAMLAVEKRLRAYLDVPEVERIQKRFPSAVYGMLFDALSLTVLVEPVVELDKMYRFRDNIFPRELDALLARRGRNIDDYIFEKVGDLMQTLYTGDKK
jgi:hypothetical protein